MFDWFLWRELKERLSDPEWPFSAQLIYLLFWLFMMVFTPAAILYFIWEYVYYNF